MKIFAYILMMVTVVFTFCTNEWEDHYEESETSVNAKLWDHLQSQNQYSDFVQYLEQFELDTFIHSSHTKTLFVPTNESFADYLQGDTAGFRQTVRYHIIPSLFMVRNVEDKRKVRTLAEKYALIENLGDAYQFDGCDITNTSPLFKDGKYYEVAQVVTPNPSLYEYLKYNNPAIHKYIDSQDTVILNKEESEPLGYNEQGQTIYDSVTTVSNLYEMEYFAISEEFRNLSATLVLPSQSTYDAALDEMALSLGGDFSSHEDIPVKWQNEALIPALLNKGTYGGVMDPGDFNKERIANIRGDSVLTDFQIDPYSRVICSNGVIYDYASFSVGDSLYREHILEGETLCDEIGVNRYAWNDRVSVERDESFQPSKSRVKGTSNDSILNVEFEENYQGRYSVTFKLKNVFPTQYRLVWRTNYRTPGEYAIYANGQRVLLGYSGAQTYDTYNLKDGFFSVLGYRLYRDDKGFCTVDGWVNNISEFGDVSITLEYIGPGEGTGIGLNIDYMALIAE